MAGSDGVANRPAKVLVFRSTLLPISETFILAQTQAMRRWEPVLAGYERTEPSLNLAQVNTVLLRKRLPRLLSPWSHLPILGTCCDQRRVASRVRSLGVALAHVHFGVDAVDAWRWLRRLHLPVVVTLHGYDASINPQWWMAGNGGTGLRDYPARLAALAREPNVHFVAVSHALRHRVAERYGIDPDRISVLHIGVDERLFRPQGAPAGERAPVVLYVGRLVEKKAADVLIRAMALVRQQLPQAKLVLIGDGPLRTGLQSLAQNLRVDAQFIGGQPVEGVRRELDRARVFCLPSVVARNGDTEGLPIAVLEAQAAGVPVITSAAGARDEGIEDGATGFSFAEGDVDRLADHLLSVLRDDGLATRFGQQAVERVQSRFRLADCTERLETFYDNVRFMYARAANRR